MSLLEILNIITIVVAILSIIIGVFAFHYATSAMIDVKALINSTHTLQTQMVPMDGTFPEDDTEIEREVQDAINQAEDQFNGLREVGNEHDIV